MSNPALEKIFTKYPCASRENLIPLLQDVQEKDGYLSEESIRDISRYLKLPSSKIYGVATFYNQFRFHPIGKFHLQLCRGTACHVNGSAKLLEAVRKILKIEPGQTTKDKMWSLETVACMGACGLSPVICVNGEFHAKVTPKSLIKILDQYRVQEAGHAGK
ncbi:MAG: NADH-quinone oxidoreductase subunit NuoE [Spirochaetales bacterium]|nr:NADH-quinone oxidoreductase subunit NuoE [Spirochaetales bacterium]